MANPSAKITEYSLQKIFEMLPEFSSKGINELVIHDKTLSGDKNKILQLVSAVEVNAPELFVSIPVEAKIIDQNLINKLSNIYCSLEIPLVASEKETANGPVLLFDKKLYSNKARLLNEAGLVFGFNMEWGIQKGDTFKLFRERLDFAASLYPNHIDFAQLKDLSDYQDPKPTGIYSSKDLDFSRGIAFACKTFYSAGRAVPWFNSVISAIKINASTLFADFEEWQQCNNCSFETEFNPENASHIEIEKMQLLFLKQKFEEKHKSHLMDVVSDIVKLNGALSRVASDSEESVIQTTYNPDDIFSPAAFDLHFFAENVTMENCSVKLFTTKDGIPDYKIL